MGSESRTLPPKSHQKAHHRHQRERVEIHKAFFFFFFERSSGQELNKEIHGWTLQDINNDAHTPHIYFFAIAISVLIQRLKNFGSFKRKRSEGKSKIEEDMCTHLCIPEFLQPWSAADPLS
jgi:hypothetical protein